MNPVPGAPVRDADEILIGFTRALRAAGLRVTQDRAHGYLTAVSIVGLDDARGTYDAGRATLCASPEDLVRYDQVHHAYFNASEGLPRERRRESVTSLTSELPTSHGEGQGEDDGADQDDVVRARASDVDLLRERDVVGLSAAEKQRLDALLATLRPRLPMRRVARHDPWRRGRVDSSRTLRASLRRMGESAPVQWRRHARRPRAVLLLMDVSGSMSGYAEVLLRLAHRISRAGAGQGGRVETFTLGTRLTRVTRSLLLHDVERAIVSAGREVPDWSGGTRLGETLQTFMTRSGQHGAARGAVVVVFSDGWERGDTTLLAEQMRRLHGIAHRVVWVNPHRGKTGYQPVQQGMMAALPFVDDFVAGHSLATYGELLEVIAMRDVLPDLVQWWRQGETVGVGTVVATFRSAPRPPGASMLVGPDETAVGSVSGGCVEGAVYSLAQEVVDSGTPVLQRYGVSDEDAFAVGLTCGGILDVWVERVNQDTFPELGEVAADIDAGRPVAVATVIEHPDPQRLGRRLVVRPDQSSTGTLGSGRADAAVTDDAMGLLASGANATLGYGPEGERRGEGMRVFVWAFAPRPRMLVFGAIDFAAAVAKVGAFLGYQVTVCDARPVFATHSRFPDADEVVVDWPHRYLTAEAEAGRIDSRTVVTVLTHDPKFDVPLLQVALALPQLAYVGAMGSRRTHDDRLARLREAGLSDAELARLSSPIGLDLGARTPEETAVSIAAEIIAGRWGGSGQRLQATEGRIHGQSDDSIPARDEPL